MFEVIWELIQGGAMVATAIMLYRHHKGILTSWNRAELQEGYQVEQNNKLYRMYEVLDREHKGQAKERRDLTSAFRQLADNDGTFLKQMNLLAARVDQLTGEAGTHIEPEEGDF
jgi:hypothetical protein